jgi:hypothetical protein
MERTVTGFLGEDALAQRGFGDTGSEEVRRPPDRDPYSGPLRVYPSWYVQRKGWNATLRAPPPD